eukprot:909248-Rhodomonas_salina.1
MVFNVRMAKSGLRSNSYGVVVDNGFTDDNGYTFWDFARTGDNRAEHLTTSRSPGRVRKVSTGRALVLPPQTLYPGYKVTIIPFTLRSRSLLVEDKAVFAREPLLLLANFS